MAKAVLMPLKYKFLGVMLLVVVSGLSVFFYVAQQTFSEDKKLFIMDSNRTLLKAATSEIKLELKSRIEELQTFIPRVYMEKMEGDPFVGLSPSMADEVLGVTFYRPGKDDGYDAFKQYANTALLTKQKLPADFLTTLNLLRPPSFRNIDKTQGIDLLNRSVHLQMPEHPVDEAVLTFVLSASFLGNSTKESFVVVDLSQRFLMRTLAQSELTEVFLVFENGTILSHPVLKTTVAYSQKTFPHPIVEKLKEKRFTRESLELRVDGEEFLCNVSETGFKNVFAVSQIRKSEAFLALKTLFEKSLWLAVIILAVSAIFSVFFASGLTTNIQKLRVAAEQLGAGNLDIKLKIKSSDEIQSVARSFQWMADRIRTLINESLEKARLADELETARLVQSTLLTPPTVQSEGIEMDSYYMAATECGGDYWDARITGQLVTIFIGDATGHGAPAAIVTAVAKSCFATLSSVFAERPLPPEQLLGELNRIIYGACRGKLLMTMCVVQLDLETGELLVANAGHESPLCLRGAVGNGAERADKKHKPKVEVFFSRGERLGFTLDAFYQVERAHLEVDDTIVLYTDGVSEARGGNGKEWGERALKKAFGMGAGLSVSQIKEQITQRLGEHTHGATQEDDITFVVFRWMKKMARTHQKSPFPKATPDFEDESELRDAVLSGLPGSVEEALGQMRAPKPKAA